jgi:hypothetical protein
LNVKATLSPRFKAGADLSKTINLIKIEFNERLTETSEVLKVKLQFATEPPLLGAVIS